MNYNQGDFVRILFEPQNVYIIDEIIAEGPIISIVEKLEFCNDPKVCASYSLITKIVDKKEINRLNKLRVFK